MPGSGGSCEWDRAGSARSCTGCPCRASGETPACTVARVKTRSGNARGDVAGPADGQRSGWVENSDGWVLYVSTCVKLDVTCAVCSVRRVHGAGYGRAELVCSRGESLGLRGFFFFF